MSYKKCETCGQKIEVDYFKLIQKLKKGFRIRYNFEPNHLVVGIDEMDDMDCSKSLLDRLVYIKDTLKDGIGSQICGLKILKTSDLEGIKVARL